AFIVGIGLTSRAFSQEASVPAADTVAQAVDTAAVAATDTAVAATDTTATATDTVAAAAPTTATGGTAATATAEAESGPNIDPQVYMNFFYGLLLVFLICVLVGVIGKIIQV